MKIYFTLSLLVLIALSLAACGTSPHHSSTPSQKPIAQLSPEELEKALEQAQIAYEKKPEILDNARVYANYLNRSGDHKKAYSVLKPVVNSQEATADDYVFMARLAEKQGLGKANRSWLKSALKSDPLDINTRLKLAAALEKDGGLEEAEKLYAEAFADEASTERYTADQRRRLYNAYSYNLIEQKRHRDSFEQLIAAKAEFPDDREIERNLRITRALMQSHGHSAPKPPERPKL